MIERALELKLAIQSIDIAQQIPEATTLSNEDWKFIERVYRALKPFKTAQKMLEGEKYVTASFVVGMIREMRKELVKSSGNDELAKRLSNEILQDFEDRWGDANYAILDGGNVRRVGHNRQKGIHPVLTIGTALDPRTKHLMVGNEEPNFRR